MLCTVCTKAFNQAINTVQTTYCVYQGWHHFDYSSLIRSAELGCYVCAQLWDKLDAEGREAATLLARARACQSSADSNLAQPAVDTENPPSGSESDDEAITTFILAMEGSPDVSSFSVSVEYDLGQQEWRPSGSIDFELCQEVEDERLKGLAAMSPLPQSTMSQTTLELARTWTQDCLENHSCCKRDPSIPPWHPTRLIQTNGDTWCIVHSDEIDVNLPYITLSHCWGNVEATKLTMDNYDRFRNLSPISELPILYRDALHAASALSVSLVWIDSLCIIQDGDNMKDWSHESTQMSKVYGMAHCNISALDAPDAHHSMFASHRPASLRMPTVFNRKPRRRPPTDDPSLPDIDRSWLCHAGEKCWDAEVTFAPINTRAWVLQERILSPRILYFGKRQVYWECKWKDAMELYPLGYSEPGENQFGLLRVSRNIRVTKEPNEEGSSTMARELLWSRLVGAYTASDLSFSEDKFVAFSALTERVSVLFQDECVLGLWKSRLVSDLGWHLSQPRQASHPLPEQYRAPTWSWASVDGTVTTNPWQPGRTLADIQDFRANNERQNAGKLTAGWMAIWCILSPVTVWGGLSINTLFLTAYTDFDTKRRPCRVWLDRLITSSIFQQLSANTALFGMPISRQLKSDNPESVYIFIMLLELVDEALCTYRRIGMALEQADPDDDSELAAENTMRVFHQPDQPPPPAIQSRDGRYLIKII